MDFRRTCRECGRDFRAFKNYVVCVDCRTNGGINTSAYCQKEWLKAKEKAMAPDEKQLWEEYDKWFFGKGISDYGTKMFGFMAAKWVHSFYAERIAELEQDRTRLAFARHRIDELEAEKDRTANDLAESDRAYIELASLTRKLIEFIDNEGPPAKEWQAISKVTEQIVALLDGGGVGDSAVIPKLKPPKYHLDENGEMVRGVGDSAVEPVCYAVSIEVASALAKERSSLDTCTKRHGAYDTPLYAHPPVQTVDVRAMTDQQILDIADDFEMGTSELFAEFTKASLLAFARTLLEHSK